MSEIFANGRIVDFIVAGVGLEAIAVLTWRAAFGRGPAPASFVSNLLSGAFLLIALRNAMAGADWFWIALCLFGALVAHAADTIARWDRPRRHDEDKRLKATISLRVSNSSDERPKM